MTKVLFIDPEKCTGCMACVLACSLEHGDTSGPVGSMILPIKLRQQAINIPVVCRQCTKPLCADACPMGAISRDDATRAMRVNPDLCIGCGMCMIACPLGGISVNAEVGRAVRTKRWKYGVTAPDKKGYEDPGSEKYVESYLYDLEADPYELTNLIGLESHRKVAETMWERLNRRMVAAGEAMVRYAVVASVTVPSDWNVEDHAEALETSVAGAYSVVRLELAQDSGFVAANLPVGLGLTRMRNAL